METKIPRLLITGTLGVGKTAVASEISELLDQVQIPHAQVDVDALRWGYFPLSPDPFQVELALKNLAAIWANFQQAGAQRLVLADVLEEREHLQRYRQAVPSAQILVIRLHASLPTVEHRLKSRELGSSIERHLRRSAELIRHMEQARVEDVCVDTEGKTVRAIAGEVLRICGWTEFLREEERSPAVS